MTPFMTPAAAELAAAAAALAAVEAVPAELDADALTEGWAVPDSLAAAAGDAVLAGAPDPSPASPVGADDAGRAADSRWPRATAFPALPPPAPPTRSLLAGADAAGGQTTGPAPTSAGCAAEPGRCTIRTDPSTNSVIRATVAVAGTRVATGCRRMTAVVPRTAPRALSMPSATMSCGAGRAGPQPRLASWRSRRSAAPRCGPVSPGSRYTVVRRAERSALPCNPDESSL